MGSRLLVAAALVGGLGSLVTAAVYVHFTARVMPSLGRMVASHGIATMQGFNQTAVQPPFMTAFFGAALAGIVLVVRALAGHHTTADLLAALGGFAYLAGFALTIGYNVPLNDRLATLDPNSPASVAFWTSYLSTWTTANTLRAVLSGVGALALGMAVALALTRRQP